MERSSGANHRIRAVRRRGEQVTPLELFFDLVFVVAITQCTALMSHEPTWTGVAQSMLVLGLLWWTWIGYAWLTSVVDPEEGGVRLAMFAAMAAVLVAALSVPHAFGDDALTLAIAYGAVRAAHVALFVIASYDAPLLRHSVAGFSGSTALGIGLVLVGSFFEWPAQGIIWLVALAIDVGGPLFFWSEGWQLVPGHFAERHGLIIIVALGESIVALGVGADGGLGGSEIVAAILGVALAAGMWWVYFDVSAITSTRRLESLPPGREQNEYARDCYSILHLPMVAGIVLIAFAMHDTLAHTDEPLAAVPAFGLAGGVAVYFLGHVAFRWRGFHTMKWMRFATAAVALALLPVVHEVGALVSLAIMTAVVWALIVYESIRYAEARDEIRHNHAQGDHH